MVKVVNARCDRCGMLVHTWVWKKEDIMDNQDLCITCRERKWGY